jgi:light-regulated signal transduction histidine kinase (bacteriophytochrome)
VLTDENGKPAFLVGTAADITERLESERRMRQFSEDLAEKTRALEVANRELESFSYSVSHDLRAPLRAVDGYAAILEEDYADVIDDEGRRYLRAVRDGAARMGQLIQDLLAFSRLSRQEMQPQQVATRSLVDAAWQDVYTSAPAAARVALRIDDLPACAGDPRLLQQVWANLLDNAVKYSSKTAEPAVHISGRTEGGETVFTVADNGAGFDMRYYDKLFQVFQRLHRESEYPGTGVGLAIVQRIIARHGGRVWADATPDHGARFCFSLPLP